MSGEGMSVGNKDNDQKWGDSCFIVFPNGTTMLIDSALDRYSEVLVANLRKMEIKRIDYFVLTHPHDDHYGGLLAEDGLLDSFEIGLVYLNGTLNGNYDSREMIEGNIDAHSVPYQILSAGDTLEVDGVTIRCLSPASRFVGNAYSLAEEVNGTSLVLRFDYGAVSALFTGDIYAINERALVTACPELLDVDILKIPHHGRNTSSCAEFAAAVSPRIAVSTGGLMMSTAVYRNYTKTGARVLFDAIDGYISIMTDGKDIEVSTSRKRLTNYYDAYEYRK
jgi:competence protein ComEC